MGLDMYLTAKRYLFGSDADDAIAGKIADALGSELGQATLKPQSIDCAALYWRKANAIHGWFVDNVQGGVDDCGRYPVHVSQLEELRDLCLHLIDYPDDARKTLPPRQGFFFGTYELDDFYWDTLADTADGLVRLLSLPTFRRWPIYYQASW